MESPQEQPSFRLWKPVELSDLWKSSDTRMIDGVTDAWFAKREELQSNSKEFGEFMGRLKREHAIETGVIERLYDLDKGVTETLIRKGFIDVQIPHRATNVPVSKLWNHLKDHMEAVDFVFDVVKENREMSIGFIHEIHALVTRNQDTSEGRDQFGHATEIPLIRGKFKEKENNPTRPDGTVVLYCPPVQVASEMDRLIGIYNQCVAEGIHPVIISAWVHHAFTTIHPYQDGNGRVARLLASLILIKNGLFPFTVRREEAKEIYINALEKADRNDPQPLVDYFCETQREHISHALNLGEKPVAGSLDEVARIFSSKLEKWQSEARKEREMVVSSTRERVFALCLDTLNTAVEGLKKQFNGNTDFEVRACPPSDTSAQHFYHGQIIQYAKRHKYYFNMTLPKGWITLTIGLNRIKWYRLGITLHHRGQDDSTLVIGAFLENATHRLDHSDRINATLPIDIKPVLISSTGDAHAKSPIIKPFIEHALTVSLGHIASEL